MGICASLLDACTGRMAQMCYQLRFFFRQFHYVGDKKCTIFNTLGGAVCR